MKFHICLLIAILFASMAKAQCVMSSNFAITHPKCHGDANGIISISVTGGTMPIQTQLNGGPLGTTTSYSGLSSGIYTVQVIDALGCTNSSVVTLTDPPLIMNTINTNYDCSLLGSVTMNTSGGTPPYSYTIFPSVGNSLSTGFSNLPIGTYTVNTQDANGCVISNSAGVNASNVSYALTHPACSNDSNGAIQINISGGGTNSYTFNGMSAGVGNPMLFPNLDTGTYVIVAQNTQPCTYSFLFTLKANKQPSYNTIMVESCGYLTLNGYTYTSSGSYNQVLTNSAGCDSILTINATVILLDTSVTNNSGVLTSNMPGVNYQWVQLNPFQFIAGANAQSYTPTVSGQYAVIVYQSSCVDTSSAHFVTVTGLESNSTDRIKIYPNPTHNEVLIEGVSRSAKVDIFDAFGKNIQAGIENIQKGFMLKLASQANGVYWIRIQDENKIQCVRLIKN